MTSTLKIFSNKIVNYFKFKHDILANVIPAQTRIRVLDTMEEGQVIAPIIGTKAICYSIKFENEKYLRKINHNNIEILK